MGNNPKHGALVARQRARSSAGGAAGARSARAPKESLHERAARLQQEGGLPREAQPGEAIAPIARAGEVSISRDDEPTTPGYAAKLLQLYGDRQLGNALQGYTPESIRAMATDVLGDKMPARASKADLISRITAQLSPNGRYSADFAAATKAARSAKAEAAAQAKAARTARSQQQANPVARTRARATGAARQELTPVLRAGQLQLGRDAGNSAYALRHLYGQSQLRAVLDGYTLKTLRSEMLPEVQARHPGTRPTSLTAKKAIADYLTERIGQEGANLPMSGDGWQMNG